MYVVSESGTKAIVVHHRHQVISAPVYNLDMRAVGSPELVGSFGLAVVLITCLETHYLRRFDQSLSF